MKHAPQPLLIMIIIASMALLLPSLFPTPGAAQTQTQPATNIAAAAAITTPAEPDYIIGPGDILFVSPVRCGYSEAGSPASACGGGKRVGKRGEKKNMADWTRQPRQRKADTNNSSRGL